MTIDELKDKVAYFGLGMNTFEDVMQAINEYTLMPLYMVNRVEVIDDSGRGYTNWDKHNRVEMELQDNDRTLKVFISKTK